ncbi:MAG: hypothetical protein DSZ08_01825 [Sulfurovum sp.]|nr:MAG: hypothetical protein DSZ08_01825 [Sulfurovum sp.]
MQVLTLEIEDDFVDKFKQVLDTFPSGKVSLKKDKLEVEIQNRIQDIDNGKEVLTPYNQGMDEMLNRIQNKYADS